jgi:hypothetical protein
MNSLVVPPERSNIMKKSLVAATAGVLAGTVLLMSATPAMAHDRIGFEVSVGLPVAPIAYVAPAPVVYGGYAPVVRVEHPYYAEHDWRYYHGYYGYRGDDRGREFYGYRHDRGYEGYRDHGYEGHDGHHDGNHDWRR